MSGANLQRQPRLFTKKPGDSDVLQQEAEKHISSYTFSHFPRKNTGLHFFWRDVTFPFFQSVSETLFLLEDKMKDTNQ